MPDGRRVVTSSWEGRVELLAVEAPGSVTIWDLQTGRDARTIGPPTVLRVLFLRCEPHGSSIALGGGSEPEGFGGASAVRAWDTSTGEELWRIGHDRSINEVAFSSDGHLLATAEWSGSADRLRVWDWTRGQVLLTIDAEGPLAQVDFDPNGQRVLLSGSDGIAEIWDVESGRRLAVLAGPPGGVKDLAFSPGGSRIATASVDGLVRLFDADTSAPQLSLRGSGCAVEGVAFSPDGTKLASTKRQYLHVDRCPWAKVLVCSGDAPQFLRNVG
jgi:WD40 repeat protein